MIAAAIWLTSDRDALSTTLTIMGAGLVLLGVLASRASGPASRGPQGVKFVLNDLVPRAAAKAAEKARDLGYAPEQVATASAAAATAAATAPAVLPAIVGPPPEANLFYSRPSFPNRDWAAAWSTFKLGPPSTSVWLDAVAEQIANQAVEAINPARASGEPKAEKG
jgi:hypothetical protein